MEQQKKTYLLSRHLNFPMMLIGIYCLFNVRAIFSSLLKLFQSGNILYFLQTFIPLVLIILLWLDRNKKIKNNKIITGIVALAYAVGTLLYNVPLFKFVLSTRGDNGYQTYRYYPILICELTEVLMCVILAAILLFKLRNRGIYYTVAALGIGAQLFLRILISLLGWGSMLYAFVSFLLPLALWYFPKVLENPDSAEITGGKLKGLLIIAAIVLVVYFCAGLATGQLGSGGSSSGSGSSSSQSHQCYVCGKSGNIKYGSYYYCPTHYAYVKVTVENS